MSVRSLRNFYTSVAPCCRTHLPLIGMAPDCPVMPLSIRAISLVGTARARPDLGQRIFSARRYQLLGTRWAVTVAPARLLKTR